MNESDTALYGLKKRDVTAIKNTLNSFAKIKKAILYGSRAKGNFRPESDIDLTLVGNELTYKDLVAIDNALNDLLLPYTFDLSIFHHIEDTDLIDHINRVGTVFK